MDNEQALKIVLNHDNQMDQYNIKTDLKSQIIQSILRLEKNDPKK